MTINPKGLWGMWCWNSLSEAQQLRLIQHGNLPIDFQPEGDDCDQPADCGVETRDDNPNAWYSGPRFYCYACAVAYLKEKLVMTRPGGMNKRAQ